MTVVGFGCRASVPVVVAPLSPQATPVATPIAAAPEKPVQGRTRTLDRYHGRDVVVTHLGRDEVILLAPRGRNVELPDVSEIDFLGRCARDFVQSQPEPARRVLIDALSHYVTGCDDGKLVLERPLGFGARDRRSRTDIAFVGTLGKSGAGLVLRVTSCGSPASFDRVSVVVDGEIWTSPRVELRRDAYNCDVGELPYTRALGNVIRAASKSAGATIQFRGTDTELVLDEAMRDELQAVLAAVDVISEP